MDIFFLSYNESLREKNWQKLKSRFPQSRRIHRIKGIGLAHRLCAHLSKTPFFFVVNADNQILDDHFTFEPPYKKLKEAVYTWRCLNPVNGLIYGFGGIKLFPKSAFLSSPQGVDISSSLKIPYLIVNKLASITHFNASELEAWRGAFRECAKLSSFCISFQKNEETKQRLKVWCEKGSDKKFGNQVLLGAKQGKEYGEKYKDQAQALKKINDFEFLEKFFKDNKLKKSKD